MTRLSFHEVLAEIQFHLMLLILFSRGRRRGFGKGQFPRIREYLRVDLGLQTPGYSQTLQRPKQYFAGLTAKPWHEAADYEWTALLERECAIITGEFNRIYSQNLFQRQHQGLDDAGQWNVFYLYMLGRKVEENCERCPHTAELIEAIPGISHSGLVYFSVLTEGAHIAPHCGPLNTRLRCHLGLVVPERCSMRVGMETRSWKEGKCLVFDDSFEHEVWNVSNQMRAVLIIDFWHPDLTSAEIWALEEIMKLSPKARRYTKTVLSRRAERLV